MLLIEYNDLTILNYNDCNIPSLGRRMLRKKIGEIDILLNNFNHAGKILEYPLPKKEILKTKSKNNFIEIIKDFKPSYTIPFASYHYYRAVESKEQNTSLLKTEISISYNELKRASKKFMNSLKNRYLFLSILTPPIYIEISDLNINIILSLRYSTIEINNGKKKNHISAHSSELYSWWNNKFGTDSFIVGGHFKIKTKELKPLKNILLLSILLENKLDLYSIILYLFKIKGWKFIINRREEIISIILNKNINIGSR